MPTAALAHSQLVHMAPVCAASRAQRPAASLCAAFGPKAVLQPGRPCLAPCLPRHRTQFRLPAAHKAAEAEQQAEGSETEVEPQAAVEFDAFDKLNDWQMLRIVTQDMPDEEVNELVWECLGYVKSFDMDPETLTVQEVWDTSNVFPKWAAKFPTPPDLLGVTRKYYPEIDRPIKEANSALARSIPMEHKKGLKEALAPLGWKGFKMNGLTPNKTRRAQVANWLIFYRKELRGVSLEELQRRKAARAAQEEASASEGPTGTTKQGVV